MQTKIKEDILKMIKWSSEDAAFIKTDDDTIMFAYGDDGVLEEIFRNIEIEYDIELHLDAIEIGEMKTSEFISMIESKIIK